MKAVMFASHAQTLNAKVGAVALSIGALMTLALTHTALPLAPLRLIALATAGFAVWSFSDEMGVRRPLNRAGLVFFSIAAFTKVQLALGVDDHFAGRYLLLYAAFLMLAVLFWSVAFLHRQRKVKLAGAVGIVTTAAPIVAIVSGHIIVGVGAALGVDGLLLATDGATPTDTHFIATIERVFGLWSYVAAWLLWRGHIIGTPGATSA